MDIQEYILSGALESYVLGLATPLEMQEAEALALEHIEVKHAIQNFEVALEKQALADAVPPPQDLKKKVMAALTAEGMVMGETNGIPAHKENGKVISITAAPKGIKWLRGAIAASVILLLGSSILNFYFYSQFKKYNGLYLTSLSDQNTEVAKNKALQANFKRVADTAMMRVQMNAAAPERAGSIATVLWNTKTKDVYLMVNNLPQHASDKQYQLWAIVDGVPVDAGMLEMNKIENGLIPMKNIKGNVQAFAITLEKKGGSPTPDMAQMYVVGKIQS